MLWGDLLYTVGLRCLDGFSDLGWRVCRRGVYFNNLFFTSLSGSESTGLEPTLFIPIYIYIYIYIFFDSTKEVMFLQAFVCLFV